MFLACNDQWKLPVNKKLKCREFWHSKKTTEDSVIGQCFIRWLVIFCHVRFHKSQVSCWKNDSWPWQVSCHIYNFLYRTGFINLTISSPDCTNVAIIQAVSMAIFLSDNMFLVNRLNDKTINFAFKIANYYLSIYFALC